MVSTPNQPDIPDHVASRPLLLQGARVWQKGKGRICDGSKGEPSSQRNPFRRIQVRAFMQQLQRWSGSSRCIHIEPFSEADSVGHQTQIRRCSASFCEPQAETILLLSAAASWCRLGCTCRAVKDKEKASSIREASSAADHAKLRAQKPRLHCARARAGTPVCRQQSAHSEELIVWKMKET